MESERLEVREIKKFYNTFTERETETETVTTCRE